MHKNLGWSFRVTHPILIFNLLSVGATSGIGAGTAVCFASLGCKLSLTGRNTTNLEKTIEDCIKAGAKKTDVSELL